MSPERKLFLIAIVRDANGIVRVACDNETDVLCKLELACGECPPEGVALFTATLSFPVAGPVTVDEHKNAVAPNAGEALDAARLHGGLGYEFQRQSPEFPVKPE